MRSCHVRPSSSQRTQRKPRKHVPTDSTYPMARRKYCRWVGASPVKLDTCKPVTIIPGVLPPKMVNRPKYCKYTNAKVKKHTAALNLSTAKCPPSDPNSARKPP